MTDLSTPNSDPIPSPTSPRLPVEGHHRVAIIGTGFSGLGLAIRLRQSGEDDFVLLERAEDVGGCWRDNTYPGCQCDVQSIVYSYSFVPKADWSRDFAMQGEIHEYLRECARRFELRPRIRFGAEVRGARWDEDSQRWIIETSRGTLTAELLVSGHGGLSAPKRPPIDGLDAFEGPIFHSAEWRHDVPLRGKRVAVIGTGASAIQIVPAIQPEVGHLDVYQRTPAWIVPRPDAPVSEAKKRLYRAVPPLRKLARLGRFAALESRILGMMTHPSLMRIPEMLSRRYLRSQVSDPALREKLTPRYAMGCKRVLLSNDFYPALTQPNVELVTSAIHEVSRRGVITEDGKLREVDAIVLCTGFRVADHPMTGLIQGRGGQTLAEYWRGGAQGYLGMSASGFPNLFLLASGPHIGLGHNSIVYIIESQIEYVLQAMKEMHRNGHAVLNVRQEAVTEFIDEMQAKLDGSIWNSGCSSFYLDGTGRNIAIWPGFSAQYRLRTRRFDLGRFELERRRPPRASAEEALRYA